MQKTIFVYLLALFFLIGSLLFLSSFFLNTSSTQNKEIGDEVIYKPDSEYEFVIEDEVLYRMFTDHITIKLNGD